jgi:hypothetical protein
VHRRLTMAFMRAMHCLCAQCSPGLRCKSLPMLTWSQLQEVKFQYSAGQQGTAVMAAGPWLCSCCLYSGVHGVACFALGRMPAWQHLTALGGHTLTDRP